MKKIALFALVIGAMSFASCKKSYHCECTFGGVTTSSVSTKYSASQAKTAQASCESSSICKWVKD